MFTFSVAKIDDDSLEAYARLFKSCFPLAHHLSLNYLRWLYKDNPCGHVVGMDAFADGKLVAHYACVPAEIMLYGAKVKALLSLNTATHPEFQGKGLFTKLAELTYELASLGGFASVFGVANANSTPGFLRKLNFQHVARLDARLGFGSPARINWAKVNENADFRRSWTNDQLGWRMRSPANKVFLAETRADSSKLYAKTDRPGVIVWAETSSEVHDHKIETNMLSPRLFLGLYPANSAGRGLSVQIPNVLRPSPLNFIYRSLVDNVVLNSDAIYFNFLDFDAY